MLKNISLEKSGIHPPPCFSILFDSEHPRQEYNERIYMQRQKIESWMPDCSIKMCTECQSQFGLLLRRHHCRACGRIFCSYCTKYRISLPREYETFPINQQQNQAITVIKDWIMGEDYTLDRVCKKCYLKYNRMQHVWFYVRLLNSGFFTIKEWRTLGILNKDWKTASVYIFSSFRRIQYSLYRHNYTQQEKDMLWSNRQLLVGHGKWMVQLVECFHNEPNKINKINRLLLSEVIIDCKYLLCSRSCRQKLNIDALIYLLQIPDPTIQKWVLAKLNDIDTQKLILFLPLFLKHISRQNRNLQDFLISKSLSNVYFLYSYYWGLRIRSGATCYQHLQQLTIALDNKNNRLGLKMQQGFTVCHLIVNTMENNTTKEESNKDKNIDSFLSSIVSKSTSSINESEGIGEIYSPINDRRQNIFQKALQNHDIVLSDIPIPTKPEWNYKKIYLDQLVYKNSASRPFVLPIEATNGQMYHLLLKKDDLRTDELIIKCIKIAKYFLVNELGDDYHLVTYNVLPINNIYGLIEIVPNAKTIYEITQTNTTLLHYVMDQNPEETVNTIRTRFMKSCAVYCVLTYLFGIGDRHLNNIMMTSQGCLFHIDYSFILGSDPKPIAPHLRITDEMLDFLGGIESNYYHQFQHHCFQIFIILKRHANVFLQILSEMCDARPPYQNQVTFDVLKNEIINRFLPGLSEQESREHFQHTIEQSHKYNTFFHRILYHPEKNKFFG